MSSGSNNTTTIHIPPKRKETTIDQIRSLFEFLEKYPSIILNGSRKTAAQEKVDTLWDKCIQLLNKLGPTKSKNYWVKVYRYQKNRVRNKVHSHGLRSLTAFDLKIYRVTTAITKLKRSIAMSEDLGSHDISEEKKEGPVLENNESFSVIRQNSRELSRQSDENRSTLLKIEQSRAEADIKRAQAFALLADAVELFAASIDRFSRKVCKE